MYSILNAQPIKVNNSTSPGDNSDILSAYVSSDVYNTSATFKMYTSATIAIEEFTAGVLTGLAASTAVIDVDFDDEGETPEGHKIWNAGYHDVTLYFSEPIQTTNPEEQFVVGIILEYYEISSGDDYFFANSVLFHDSDCSLSYELVCADGEINGIDYFHELRVKTYDPHSIFIETNYSLASLVDYFDPRWVHHGNGNFSFYFTDPFDLQITNCDGIREDVNGWSDCISCYMTYSIEDAFRFIDGALYSYQLLISTNSPELIFIEHTYQLEALINSNNDRFIDYGFGNYGILFEQAFDMQLSDCDGTTFTAEGWPVQYVGKTIAPGYNEFIPKDREDIVAYPNPVISELNLESSIDGTMTMFNSNGKYIQSFNVNKSRTTVINMSDLDQGLYFLKDKSGNVTQKIVKL